MVHGLLYLTKDWWGCAYSHRGTCHRSNSAPWINLCMLVALHFALAKYPEEKNMPVAGWCTPHNISTSYIQHVLHAHLRQPHMNPLIVPRAQLHSLHAGMACFRHAATRLCLVTLPPSLSPDACCCACWWGLCLPRDASAPPALLPRDSAAAGLQKQYRNLWWLEGHGACKGHTLPWDLAWCTVSAKPLYVFVFYSPPDTQHVHVHENPFCLKRRQLCNAFDTPLAKEWFLVTPMQHTSCVAFSLWKLKINVEWHAASDSVPPAASLRWALLTIMQAWHLATCKHLYLAT